MPLTDHDDTGAESLGREREQAGLAGNLADRFALVIGLAEKGDKGVGGMGDDSADDTGEVPGGEGNAELGALAVRVLGGGEDPLVELRDNVLEEEEFGHGVRNLESLE